MNTKNSVYLSIAQIIILAAGLISASATGIWPATLWVVAAITITIVTGTIGFANKPENNDGWKGWLQIIALAAVVLIFSIPFSQAAIQ